jgi:hypothetical protein
MSQKISGGILGFCLLLLGFPGFGRETATRIEPAGLIPVIASSTEWPDRVRIMQDYNGGAYVFCIDGKRLRIFKADGQGGIETFSPEGLPETIENVRSLELSVFGNANYAAFIGREGQTEAIYALGMDFQGNLRYFPVPETRTAGSITAYRITGFANGSAAVYFLTEGRLYCVTGIGGPDIGRQKNELDTDNETAGNITAFDLSWDFFHNFGCIWFTAAKKTGTELNLCVISDNQMITRLSAGIYPEVTVSMLGGIDAINCTITSGMVVELYRVNMGGFIKEASFTAPATVNRYFDLKTMGILIEKTGDEGVQMIYGVTNERRGLPLINSLFEIDSNSIPSFYYTWEDGISFFYRKSGIWRFLKINADGKILKTDMLPGVNDSAKILCTGGIGILGIYFIEGGNDTKSHTADAGRFRIAKYQYKESVWAPEQSLPLPADIDTTGCVLSGWVNNSMFLVFSAREGLALFRMGD